MIGEEAKAMEVSRKLLENGVYASPIVFPTVAKGKARIRFMVSASHTKEQLESVVNTLKNII
jgi:glycine C-acetyltransferase